MAEIANSEIDVAGGFSCENCGGVLSFAPGTSHLKCNYCEHENEIPECREIVELDFESFVKEAGGIPEMNLEVVSCKSCGATTSLPENISAKPCPFCNNPLSAADRKSEKWISPGAIIPFKINDSAAKQAFNNWLKKLWYKPKGLKEAAQRADRFHGIYMPYWTFDADTNADYVGQRGTYYYVTVPYTTTVNGKTVTRVKQVRKTSWKTVSGKISHFFDDLLVPSSKQMPNNLKENLEPWKLKEDAITFSNDYLAGFQAEKYQIGLEEGFTIAKANMKNRLNDMARRDIGGDEQRVLSLSAEFNEVKFKYILLPIWISTYIHRNKRYTCLVNGQTGKVSAERPFDYLRLILHILIAAGIIALAVYLLH
jgi:LSD1 subclass zinc finger protein